MHGRGGREAGQGGNSIGFLDRLTDRLKMGDGQAQNPGAILSQRNNWRLRETGPSSRLADRFILSSATKLTPDSGLGDGLKMSDFGLGMSWAMI